MGARVVVEGAGEAVAAVIAAAPAVLAVQAAAVQALAAAAAAEAGWGDRGKLDKSCAIN